MGKIRKPRSKPINSNPIGSMEITEEENIDDRLNPVEIIQKQLNSANNEDKMCGLQTLSMLCQNERNIQAILNSEIVRIVGPFLVDADHNIQHSAAGAIRNLSAVSVDVCEKLVELDAFTSLLVLLNEYAKLEWKPTIDSHGGLDQRSDTFLQAVNIVWNLCESTSLAVETFNQSQLLRSFVRCLNYEVYGLDIATSVAQCLLVISEDNVTAWNILAEYSNDFLTLLNLDSSDELKVLSTITAAVVANVPVLCAAHTNTILAALVRILDINQREVLNKISSSLPFDDEENDRQQDAVQEVEMIDEEMEADDTLEQSENLRKKRNTPSQFELEIRKVELLLLAQRIAAESLTNICSGDEENNYEDVDDEGMSDAESVHDYDATENPDTLKEMDKLPVALVEAIKSLGVIEKMYQRCQTLPENVRQILKEHGPNIYRRYIRLRTSLLLCIQNFCDVLSLEDLGGANAVYTVWLELGQQVFQGEQESDVIEACTALMRATLNHLKKHPELFTKMTADDLSLMLKGIGTCTDTDTRANWLKMLGILGCVLPATLVKNLIVFMITSCMKEEDCWTLSEGIDAFMDIFADNDWPELIIELKLTQKCKEIDRILRAKVNFIKMEPNLSKL